MGLADEIKHLFNVAWQDNQNPDKVCLTSYLFLSLSLIHFYISLLSLSLSSYIFLYLSISLFLSLLPLSLFLLIPSLSLFLSLSLYHFIFFPSHKLLSYIFNLSAANFLVLYYFSHFSRESFSARRLIQPPPILFNPPPTYSTPILFNPPPPIFFDVLFPANNPTRRLQGFKYLYLTPEDYQKVSSLNSVNCELIEDEGQSRYRIVDIIGEKDGIGVESLSGSGMIAGETAHAYNEVVTISLVSGQWSVVSGQWTGSGTGLGGETAHAYNEVVTISLVSGQWSVVSGQWTGSGTGLGGETAHAYNEVVTISLVSGQWSVVSGQWTGSGRGQERGSAERLPTLTMKWSPLVWSVVSGQWSVVGVRDGARRRDCPRLQ